MLHKRLRRQLRRRHGPRAERLLFLHDYRKALRPLFDGELSALRRLGEQRGEPVVLLSAEEARRISELIIRLTKAHELARPFL